MCVVAHVGGDHADVGQRSCAHVTSESGEGLVIGLTATALGGRGEVCPRVVLDCVAARVRLVTVGGHGLVIGLGCSAGIDSSAEDGFAYDLVGGGVVVVSDAESRSTGNREIVRQGWMGDRCVVGGIAILLR